MVVPFYSDAQEFRLLHILANVWCCQSLILAILVGICRCLIVVLFCIFLMTNDVKHFFLCFVAIWIFPFVKFLFKPFVYFKNCVLYLFIRESQGFFIYSVYMCFVRHVFQISSSSLRLATIFLMVYFFILMKHNYRSFKNSCFLCSTLRYLCLLLSLKDILLHFLLEALWFSFWLRSIIHLKSIFVSGAKEGLKFIFFHMDSWF